MSQDVETQTETTQTRQAGLEAGAQKARALASAMRGEMGVIYDDGRLRVSKNHSGDLFISDIKSGTEIRLSSYPNLDGGLQFTTRGRVEPIRITNTIGWRIANPS